MACWTGCCVLLDWKYLPDYGNTKTVLTQLSTKFVIIAGFCFLSLLLSHTHTHTHTDTLPHTDTHTHTHSHSHSHSLITLRGIYVARKFCDTVLPSYWLPWYHTCKWLWIKESAH